MWEPTTQQTQLQHQFRTQRLIQHFHNLGPDVSLRLVACCISTCRLCTVSGQSRICFLKCCSPFEVAVRYDHKVSAWIVSTEESRQCFAQNSTFRSAPLQLRFDRCVQRNGVHSHRFRIRLVDLLARLVRRWRLHTVWRRASRRCLASFFPEHALPEGWLLSSGYFHVHKRLHACNAHTST